MYFEDHVLYTFLLRTGVFILLCLIVSYSKPNCSIAYIFQINWKLASSTIINESRIVQSRTISPVPSRRATVFCKQGSVSQAVFSTKVSMNCRCVFSNQCVLISTELCSTCYQYSKRGDTCFFDLYFRPLPLVLGRSKL